MNRTIIVTHPEYGHLRDAALAYENSQISSDEYLRRVREVIPDARAYETVRLDLNPGAPKPLRSGI